MRFPWTVVLAAGFVCAWSVWSPRLSLILIAADCTVEIAGRVHKTQNDQALCIVFESVEQAIASDDQLAVVTLRVIVQAFAEKRKLS